MKLAKLVIEYALNTIEEGNTELFKQAVRKYLPLQLGDTIMVTLADAFREEGILKQRMRKL